MLIHTSRGDVAGIVSPRPGYDERSSPQGTPEAPFTAESFDIDLGVATEAEARALGVAEGDTITAKYYTNLVLRLKKAGEDKNVKGVVLILDNVSFDLAGGVAYEPDRESVIGRALTEGRVVHIEDAQTWIESLLALGAGALTSGPHVAEEPGTVVVLPRGRTMPALPMPARLRGLTGQHDSRRFGQGGALRDVHPFLPGDSVRQIDWKVTARRSPGLEQLYVRRPWTGRGIGSRLLAVAKERRPDGLQLWTFQVNAGARRFYERHGFVVVEMTDGSANEERQPDVRYAWNPPIG